MLPSSIKDLNFDANVKWQRNNLGKDSVVQNIKALMTVKGVRGSSKY